jgi:hypothetical protein
MSGKANTETKPDRDFDRKQWPKQSNDSRQRPISRSNDSVPKPWNKDSNKESNRNNGRNNNQNSGQNSGTNSPKKSIYQPRLQNEDSIPPLSAKQCEELLKQTGTESPNRSTSNLQKNFVFSDKSWNDIKEGDL